MALVQVSCKHKKFETINDASKAVFCFVLVERYRVQGLSYGMDFFLIAAALGSNASWATRMSTFMWCCIVSKMYNSLGLLTHDSRVYASPLPCIFFWVNASNNMDR